MHNWPLISDVMDKRFVKLNPEMTITEASTLLLKERLTGAAVVNKKDELVGILSEKDCLKNFLYATYHKVPDGKVEDFMTVNPITVTGTMDIVTAAQLFLNHDFRRLPVVEHEKLIGQITRLDLLRTIQRLGGVHTLAS